MRSANFTLNLKRNMKKQISSLLVLLSTSHTKEQKSNSPLTFDSIVQNFKIEKPDESLKIYEEKTNEPFYRGLKKYRKKC